MKKTSFTDPLQIAVVTAAPEFGRIGITFCPGKYDRHAMSGRWDRDLALDLDMVRDWGAAAVVTLLEPKELTPLRVERLGEEDCAEICVGSIFRSLTCQFQTSGSSESGISPVRNCALCCVAR